MARLAWVLLAFGAAACVGPDIPEVVTGDWGGLHLGMIATETGADLDFRDVVVRSAVPDNPRYGRPATRAPSAEPR